MNANDPTYCRIRDDFCAAFPGVSISCGHNRKGGGIYGASFTIHAPRGDARDRAIEAFRLLSEVHYGAEKQAIRARIKGNAIALTLFVDFV
jgi:hypothetical protein